MAAVNLDKEQTAERCWPIQGKDSQIVGLQAKHQAASACCMVTKHLPLHSTSAPCGVLTPEAKVS